MLKWLADQGPTFNAVLITTLTMIPVLFAFGLAGWPGVSVLGLTGLMIAVRFDMTEDAAAGDFTRQPYVYEAQVQERARRNPLQAAAEARSRAGVLSVVYLVFGTVAGLGMSLTALTLL